MAHHYWPRRWWLLHYAYRCKYVTNIIGSASLFIEAHPHDSLLSRVKTPAHEKFQNIIKMASFTIMKIAWQCWYIRKCLHRLYARSNPFGIKFHHSAASRDAKHAFANVWHSSASPPHLSCRTEESTQYIADEWNLRQFQNGMISDEHISVKLH